MTNLEIFIKISEILREYGDAPEIGDSENVWPQKLLNCIEQMHRIIEGEKYKDDL